MLRVFKPSFLNDTCPTFSLCFITGEERIQASEGYIGTSLQQTLRRTKEDTGKRETKKLLGRILLEMRALGLVLNRSLCLIIPTTCISTETGVAAS